MRNVNLDNLRVMVISSHDHGSLAETQYFLQGQHIAKNAVVLVPPRLEEAIAGEKSTRYEVWSSIEDLYALVDEHRPDFIYMVSGYLLCLQEYATVDELLSFFKHCEKSGCILLTNDPMAGALSQMIVEIDDGSYTIKPDLDLPKRSRHLINVLIEPFKAMKAIPHIYPWVCEQDPLQNHTNLGYFNPRYLEHLQNEDANADFDGVSHEKPFWLFALGPEDYKDVLVDHGKKNCVQWTAEKVRFTLEQDRDVVVVGPIDFIEAMKDEMGDVDGLSLHFYLPFPVFNRLTFTAEKVFFWNVLSASAIMRTFFGLPTFHFEIGHIGKSLRLAYDEVVRLGLGGCEPLMIDQSMPFTSEKIETLTRRFSEFTERRSKHLSGLREPDQVVQELITAQKIPVWTFWDSDDTPPLVKRCLESWERHLDPEHYEIRILTHETFENYLPFNVLNEIPQFFDLRYAQQTDYMRLALLKWHGGIWLDASIYMVDQIPFDRLSNEFYAPRIPSVDSKCVQSWLLVAPRQNEVITAWLDEFTVALQDRRDIKLRLFSLSLYSGFFARLMQLHDPTFKNYFMIYYVYENLYRTRRWFKKKTPNLTEQGITTSLQPDNVKFIFNDMRYATVTKLFKRFDPTEKWKVTQKFLKQRKKFIRVVVHRENLPSISMRKDGKIILYKLNASDRLLMKDDFDFDSCR